MTESEAYEKLLTIGQRTIDKFGDYEKPKSLKLLEKSNIDTDKLGFYVGYDYHYDSTPIDTIPFAATGGDGCHFCFLTDFGRCKDLNQAPILFISPTDYDDVNPHFGTFLYAKNFIDFIRINITTTYPEIIRFEDLREMDFDRAIIEIQSERDKSDVEEINSIKNKLSDLFNIQPINKLNHYYKEIYGSRVSDKFIGTKDRINIFYNENKETLENMPTINDDLEDWLKRSNRKSRTKLYRELPNIFPYYKPGYQITLKRIVEHLENDGYHREAQSVKFEAAKSIEYYKANEKYKEIRKLKTRDNNK